ncbi:MAG: DNA polymerase Y family protein [Phycisphaerae bacterium]
MTQGTDARPPPGSETDTAADNRPLVLTRRAGSSLIVEHTGPRARQLGLHAGMTLGQAQAIAPKLLAFEHEAHRDRALLEQLANWALRFSPIVQPVEPGTLLLDITGCQRLFGSEADIARQALDGLRRQGFHAQAAIADTVGAACALATASGDALVVAAEGQTSISLAPLPPAALRIEPGVAGRLETLGVRTIGDLLMLPRSLLPARFGPQLVLRLQQALGEVYEEVTAHEFEEPPAARLVFETPLRDLQAVQAAVAQLLEELFAQLLERTLALRRLDCVLTYEQVPPTVLKIGLSRASRAWRHVAELVQRRLEPAGLSGNLIGVQLVARETSRFKPGQIDLFEPGEPGREEEFGCLLDRLMNRLGYDAVVRAELVDDYQPERAFRYIRVGGAEKRGKRGHSDFRRKPTPVLESKPKIRTSPFLRPTQLLPRPLPIRVIALLPDGPPTWLALRGRQYVVARAWGPERIETAWWRGPDIRRDYFRVSVETGEQFWIFHRPADGQWYLHGVFA